VLEAIMKLSDLMQRNVRVIAGDTTVREAAQRMKDADVGALPVREDDRIIGMLTDRDLVVRSIARGDDPDRTRAVEVMTRDVAWCYVDESIDVASRKMSECQVQRLLVLDRQDKLVGIVSLGDLARARGNAPTVTHALEEIKAPTKSTALGAEPQRIGH
jgi:CBS domain-containing protein